MLAQENINKIYDAVLGNKTLTKKELTNYGIQIIKNNSQKQKEENNNEKNN